MFGNFSFADATFADSIVAVVIRNKRGVHGRTKVAIVIDSTTGKALIINSDVAQYKLRTKVEKQIIGLTGINLYDSEVD